MNPESARPWYRFEPAARSGNWFETLELKRRPLIIALALVSFAIVAATALRLSWAYDVYWHLQMGKDWAENGLSLFRDHYSFTFNGADIRSPAALFEIGIHYLVSWLGLETAFKAYKFLAMGLTLGLFLFWLRWLRAPAIAYLIVLPLATYLLQLRALERPELIGFALMVFSVFLYQRALDRERLTLSTVAPIVVLILFWTNYHAAILAYVVFFGLFLDLALRLWRERAPPGEWMAWFGWGVVVLIAGFANGNFSHPVLESLSFDGVWREHILEYAPPVRLLASPPLYVVAAFAALTLWLLVRQRKFGMVFVLLLFVHQAVSTVRMVAPAGLFMLSVFAVALRDADPAAWFARLSRVQAKAVSVALSLMIAVTVLATVFNARAFIAANQHLDARYPRHMVQYLRDSNASGRIFNEYGLGGYLVHGLEGELEIYIDGRTNILYPFDHFLRYEEALKNPSVFREEVEKYDIEYAAFTNHPQLVGRMYESGTMGLDFVDLRHSLYRRSQPNFPLMGYLWAYPACWEPGFAARVGDEQLTGLLLLPGHSPLNPYMELVASYGAAVDDAGRREVLAAARFDETVRTRFIGYRALETGDFELAVRAFEAVVDKEHRDLLAVAWAYLELGDFDAAEERLDLVTRAPVEQVHPNDVRVLHLLMSRIAAAGELRRFGADYVEQLAAQVGQLDGEPGDRAAGFALLCTTEPPAF